MGRRSGFSGLLTSIAREAARQQRMAEKVKKQNERELIRQQKEYERLKRHMDKEAKQRYLEEQLEETEEKNNSLRERLSELSSILEWTLLIDDSIDFDILRIKNSFHPFNPPRSPSEY